MSKECLKFLWGRGCSGKGMLKRGGGVKELREGAVHSPYSVQTPVKSYFTHKAQCLRHTSFELFHIEQQE